MTDVPSRPDTVGMSRSFQPRQWFPHGFDGENGVKIMWVYKPEEAGGHTMWLVGFFYPDGTWFTESSYDCNEKAAARVNYLNGGKQ